MTRTRLVLCFTFPLAAPLPFAAAQWTVTSLNPADSTHSEAYAVSDGQQAGTADFGGHHFHAGFWTGTSSSGDRSRTGRLIAIRSPCRRRRAAGRVCRCGRIGVPRQPVEQHTDIDRQSHPNERATVPRLRDERL